MGSVAYIPALIGAVVSVALIQSSFLGFLFLLPLGVIAYCYTVKSAWFTAALIILGNTAFSLMVGLFRVGGVGELAADVFYLAAAVLAFTWLTAPPAKGPGLLRLPAAYRLIAGSVLLSLAFALVIYTAGENWGFRVIFREQAEAFASIYAATAGADVVQRSLLEQYMTADAIMEILRIIALRGGMLASCVLLLFVSRQLSLGITWVVRHKRPAGSIIGFHVKPECIWVLSFSLLAVLAGMRFRISTLEIAGWNVLVICSILYLTQGGGIAIFFLTRVAISPMMRFFLNLMICVVILSPGINAVALGVLLLLGIAENWVPFRAPKTNGPSSTPGMGE
jgi:hypothetical protein